MRRTAAEKCRAHPDHARAHPDTDFKIPAHAHRKLLDARIAGQGGQLRKVRPGGLTIGGDAHQTNNIQTVFGTATPNKRGDLGRRDAGLLRFATDIDLHEAGQLAIDAHHLGCQRLRQPIPIHRLDYVKQRHGIANLVGLQRPDQMQGHVRIGFPQARPFVLGLLYAIFPEDALTGCEEWRDFVRRKRLGNSNQRNRLHGCAKTLLRGADATIDGSEVGTCVRVHAVARFLLT